LPQQLYNLCASGVNQYAFPVNPLPRGRRQAIFNPARERTSVDFSGNEVLITGGATGIGLGLAEKFLAAGSRVAICGRRKEALEEAARKHPGLITCPCDLTSESERLSLSRWIVGKLPRLNVLVNNAGIQQRMRVDQEDFWPRAKEEIAINWEAPVHLTCLLLETLKKSGKPCLINVTSGLAFVPLAGAPVYCATKAAFHSFTRSLRPLLEGSGIEVIEIIPPAVNTDLGGAGLHTTGTPLEEFISAVARQLQEGKTEVSYGFSEKVSHASRDELEQAFQRMNSR